MPAPADTETLRSQPILLCAAGLFLTIVEVNGFGFDFANDTLGFVLVCIGAVLHSDDRARRWSALAAASAGLAAMVSLFTYGGPAGQILPMTYRWWDVMLYLDATTTAGVVIGLLLVARVSFATSTGTAPWPARSLPVLAAIFAAATATQMLLFASQSAFFGPLGHLRQVIGIVIGLLECLTVLVVFLAARSPNRNTKPR